MKRARVGLDAFGRAARGKRCRADVRAFTDDLEASLARLQQEILDGSYHPLPMRSFSIRDPKPRIIHAPRFRDRVVHHALMAHVGPVLDRSLMHDVHACREGKGALAAVKRAQGFLRKGAWYGQIDIRHYFPNIPHARLLGALSRKFSDHGLLRLFERLVGAHQVEQGRGLPIGALISQAFANFFLIAADRAIMAVPGRRGFIRYMDDIVWWADDKRTTRRILDTALDVIEGDLGLEVKRPTRIAPSSGGLSYCGYRVFANRLMLSRRRKRRYAGLRENAEQAWLRGDIGARALQIHGEAAIAITRHADAGGWRAEQLARTPLVPALLDA